MEEQSYRHSSPAVEAEWKLALEQLRAARQTDMPRVAVSHAYYSMFHAMTAALLKQDVVAHSHSGVIDKFTFQYVKTKEIPQEWGRIIQQLFRWRQDADYAALKEVTPDQAKEAIKQATAFLKIVKALLEKK